MQSALKSGATIAEALEHHRAGRLPEAERGYRALLEREPRDAEALHLLGLVAHQAGHDSTARDLIERAIGIAPRKAAYRANLGVVLLRMRHVEEAASSLRAAIRLDPADFGAQSNLGAALAALGDHDGAVKAAGAALRLRPGDPPTLCNRGQWFAALGQHEQALSAFDAALRGDPAYYLAHLACGTMLLSIGRPQAALDALAAADSCAGADLRAGQARIVAMNYLPGATMALIGAAARSFAPRLFDAAGHSPPAGEKFNGLDRSPDRPLRIGYVSADFRGHPVGYFLCSVLEARDRAGGDVFCYDNAPTPDAMTARLQAAVDGWRPIFGLDDERAAEAIRVDGIDILVDLGGHTNGNRLGVFARRAAPVQVSWLGYFGTTGLSAMDAVIADRHVLPPSDEADIVERILKLPDSYLCFSPPPEAGPVAPLPAGAAGAITFGCFNNPAKLNPGVLALWARVLAAVPGARLLLKSAQYADKAIRREIADVFAARGVARERILFEPASPIAAMFEAYGRVDIALDPFPFAGGATTAQALWMGVPVVSLIGTTWPGRQGASLLTAAGFPQWAVPDEDAYLALACDLAMDRSGLAALRQGLRARVAASPLCDADRFAGHLAEAYRTLWRDYVRGAAEAAA